MMHQKKFFIILCIIIGLSASAFTQRRATVSGSSVGTQTSTQGGIVVYSNSFESSQDTVGWRGTGSREFRGDAAPDGGQQSLYVSGGCLWPHAWIELTPDESDGLYILRCWGKDLQIGGEVELNVEGSMLGPWITVNQKEWVYYESADTLCCPAGKKIVLSMGAGGIVPSAMLVDRIEIVRVGIVTSIRDNRDRMPPQTFVMLQSFPNPFNPTTRLRYEIPRAGLVLLEIYDRLGRKVTTLIDRYQQAGEYEVEWNAERFASGVYFCRLESGLQCQTRKLLLIK